MSEADGPLIEGTVVEIHGMWATVLPLAPPQERLRCRLERKRKTPAIGDRVQVDPSGDRPQIVETAERTRSLYRPKAHGATIMATDVSRIVIVVATQPRVKFGLVDRLIVAAQAEDIDVVIALNKSDMEGHQVLCERFEPYEALGYSVYSVSALTGAGVDAIRKVVDEGISVFIGHSGVGKSTLLNHLIPGADLATKPLSRATGKGQHTTSVSTCHPFGKAWPQGGLIVDTPGIRTFGLQRIPPETIGAYYPEFAPYLGHCKFRNCVHATEPGCAVRAALEAGEISQERYHRYLGILESVQSGEG